MKSRLPFGSASLERSLPSSSGFVGCITMRGWRSFTQKYSRSSYRSDFSVSSAVWRASSALIFPSAASRAYLARTPSTVSTTARTLASRSWSIRAATTRYDCIARRTSPTTPTAIESRKRVAMESLRWGDHHRCGSSAAGSDIAGERRAEWKPRTSSERRPSSGVRPPTSACWHGRFTPASGAGLLERRARNAGPLGPRGVQLPAALRVAGLGRGTRLTLRLVRPGRSTAVRERRRGRCGRETGLELRRALHLDDLGRPPRSRRGLSPARLVGRCTGGGRSTERTPQDGRTSERGRDAREPAPEGSSPDEEAARRRSHPPRRILRPLARRHAAPPPCEMRILPLPRISGERPASRDAPRRHLNASRGRGRIAPCTSSPRSRSAP